MRFADFERLVAERLALSLLSLREELEARHLRLIASHNAFRSRLIWRVVVAAGVRPYLQEHRLYKKYGRYRYGHNDPKEWDAIVRHYRQLMKHNQCFAYDVMREVPKVLTAGRDTFDEQEIASGTHICGPAYLDSLLGFISFTPLFVGMTCDYRV
jgi:hypothetical protein